MNELRVNDPFGMEPMDAMFRNMLRPWRAELAERAPQIKLDVHESDASYTVKAEVPGVKKDDIDVRIDGSQVTISAEVKKDQEEKKDGRVIRSETDRGVVLLIDTRFAEQRYRRLYPAWWQPARVRSTAEIRNALAEFWQASPPQALVDAPDGRA